MNTTHRFLGRGFIHRDGGQMHSDEEVFRGTVRVRGPNGDARVWLTVNGARRTTVSMVDSEVAQLCELLTKAQQASTR